jgi:hypothetical protein
LSRVHRKMQINSASISPSLRRSLQFLAVAIAIGAGVDFATGAGVAAWRWRGLQVEPRAQVDADEEGDD